VPGKPTRADDRSTARRSRRSWRPGPDRIWYVGDAFAHGMSVEEIHELTNIDPWFLAQIEGARHATRRARGQRSHGSRRSDA
jgi:carbamoyl-phosphate synthase large subunit